MDWFVDSALRCAVLQGTSPRSLREALVYGLLSCSSVSIWRRSDASSLSLAFSWRTRSWLSDTWFNLSIRLWFSVRRRTTWDQSSSRCLCFRILDLRADSLLEIILRCFLSSMILSCCSSASSEVELLLRLDDCEVMSSWPCWGIREFGKLAKSLLRWKFGCMLACIIPKFAGSWAAFSGAR